MSDPSPAYLAFIAGARARKKANTPANWARYFKRKAKGIREPCPECAAGPENPSDPCRYCVTYNALHKSI